jgi:hypothetical protein
MLLLLLLLLLLLEPLPGSHRYLPQRRLRVKGGHSHGRLNLFVGRFTVAGR